MLLVFFENFDSVITVGVGEFNLLKCKLFLKPNNKTCPPPDDKEGNG